MQTKKKTKVALLTLLECAIMVALATVLGFYKIKFGWGYGGSITLASMIPLVIIAYRHGPVIGCLTGCLYGCVNMLTDIGTFAYVPAKTLLVYAAVILLDYIIAFGVIGLAGLFRKKVTNHIKGAAWAAAGAAFAITLRLVCHFLSGVLIWGEYAGDSSVILYSLGYNAGYMIPEIIITSVAIMFIVPRVIDIFKPKS